MTDSRSSSNIEILNVTAIAAQVDRDAIGSGLFTRHRGSDHTRLRRATRLPHGGDVIDVDVETSAVIGLYLIIQVLYVQVQDKSLRLQLMHRANRGVVNSAARLLPDQVRLRSPS